MNIECGDKVEVADGDYCYNYYEHLADVLNIMRYNWAEGEIPKLEKEYKVIQAMHVEGIFKDEYPDKEYAVILDEETDKRYIMDPKGLKERK